MAKRYQLNVTLTIPSNQDTLVNPILTDLEFAGWGAPVEEHKTASFTYLTYNLEVEADGRTVAEQIKERLADPTSYVPRHRVPEFSGPSGYEPAGERRLHLHLEQRKGPKREDRKRRSKQRP